MTGVYIVESSACHHRRENISVSEIGISLVLNAVK
jgi:hypothetical protein